MSAVKWSPDFPDLQVGCRPVNRTSSRRDLAGRPADRLADRSDGAPSGPLQDRRSPRLHLTYSVCSRHRQRYPDDDVRQHRGLPAVPRSHRVDLPAPEGSHSRPRSEEHTSELPSLMRISYAVFCLQKKNTKTAYHTMTQNT